MLMVFVRAMVMYIVVMLTMRLMGKRMIGQLQPFELAVAMLMADLAAAPLSDLGIPLLYGIVPMLALLFLHSTITLMSCKIPAVRRLVSGKATVLIKDGAIDYRELKRQCYSINDLMEALRVAGQLDIAQVGTAILETNGQLSAFPDPKYRPVNTQVMQVQPDPEGAPVVLILDGSADDENLRLLGRDADWLRAQLGALGLTCGRTLLCTLDAGGALYAQDYDGRRYRRQLSGREAGGA